MIFTQLDRARLMEADAERSYRDLQQRLYRVASPGTPSAIAHAVSRRYRVALNETDEAMRELRWREFIGALHAFLALASPPRSADALILQSIVDENADLCA